VEGRPESLSSPLGSSAFQNPSLFRGSLSLSLSLDLSILFRCRTAFEFEIALHRPDTTRPSCAQPVAAKQRGRKQNRGRNLGERYFLLRVINASARPLSPGTNSMKLKWGPLAKPPRILKNAFKLQGGAGGLLDFANPFKRFLLIF
jgi:hypothetical protein